MVRSKRTLFFVTLLVLVGIGIWTFSSKEKAHEAEEEILSGEHSLQVEEQPSVSSELSPEGLEDYYRVYENPYVLHIRKALNGYLDGTNVGLDDPELVIESQEIAGATAGLSSFDKSYYESKFIVYTISDSIAGGKQVNIIFQDKPDKVFAAWVYQLGDGTYDLRAFWENINFTEEDIASIQDSYKTFLEDKEHAL